MNNQFTQKEKDLITKLYPHHPTRDIAIRINRSEASVYRYAYKNGIYKSLEYLATDASGRSNIKLGAHCRFPKGHVPANKGTKMPEHIYQKVKKTFFKKGQLPPNTASGNGAITVRNGVKFIRIALSKWVPLHVHIWHQAYGKYNSNTHVLTFINGNNQDVCLENLELITRAENCRRNRNRYLNLPPELKQTISLINKLNTKIKKHGKATV